MLNGEAMKKIMIVEDEEVVWRTYVSFLRTKGYEAIIAVDGLDALKLFEQHRPDIVLLDFFVPVLRGDTILEGMKKINPKVKIFFVTGSKAKIDEMKSRNVPADGFILKPINFDDFFKLIEENK